MKLLIPIFALGLAFGPLGSTDALAQEHHQAKPASPQSSPPQAGVQVGIAPYLVDIRSDSALLSWRTKTARPQTARLINLETAQVKRFEVPPGQQQSVHFEGLTPDTEYRWELEGTYSGTLQTLPEDAERRFAVLGHTHGSEYFGHYPDRLLVNKIAATRPQFVVHTGDCVFHTTPKEWKQHFFQVFREVLTFAPVYVAPGNHDSGWPFLDGIELRPFKELFPHAYPEEVGTGPGAAYYAVEQGPLLLLFLSYVTDLGPDSLQRQWIHRTLQASKAEFKVIVMGGFDNYYDRKSLPAFLAGEKVDAILRGDGTAPLKTLSDSAGVPVFSVGTSHREPHPWLDASVSAEHLILREMTSTGKAKEAYWLHAKRKRASVFDLPKPSIESGNNAATIVFKLEQPISSAELRGLQFQIEGMSTPACYCYMTFIPTERLVEDEGGFRSQHILLSSKDSQAAIPIPAERPIRGGAYEISEIRLRLGGCGDGPISIPKAWLY